ncbi:MAG: insulinase family protein [Nanoarchaeota archaeon]|nr:insulinase family protein [Nanoarchaeota archaeon]MBU0963187.1 insulinase family protein [Nanoarchaeota archaeon]
MQKKILKNRLTVIHNKRDSDTVVIQVLIKTGPIFENEKIGGIAHFIEHLLFETKNRSNKELSSEIESLGGIINAFTSEEFTCFYVHIPKKYLNLGLEVLSDVIQNPAFNPEFVETERNVILEEIKLWSDDPKLHRWELFKKALFGNHPMGNSSFGSINSMKSITIKDLEEFYNKYYTPNNSIISIVGDVDNVFDIIEKKFSFTRKLNINTNIDIAKGNKRTELTEKKSIDHTYLVLGYKTPIRTEKDSYVFDIIDNILGYGISSRLADEIRNKRGLAYQVSTDSVSSKFYGYFAVFLSTDKKNIPEVKKIILNEFNKLQDLTESDVEKAKRSIEGSFLIRNVDPIQMVTAMNMMEFVKDVDIFNDYLKNIKKVSLEDVKSVAKQYLNEDYTLILIEQS